MLQRQGPSLTLQSFLVALRGMLLLSCLALCWLSTKFCIPQLRSFCMSQRTANRSAVLFYERSQVTQIRKAATPSRVLWQSCVQLNPPQCFSDKHVRELNVIVRYLRVRLSVCRNASIYASCCPSRHAHTYRWVGEQGQPIRISLEQFSRGLKASLKGPTVIWLSCRAQLKLEVKFLKAVVGKSRREIAIEWIEQRCWMVAVGRNSQETQAILWFGSFSFAPSASSK